MLATEEEGEGGLLSKDWLHPTDIQWARAFNKLREGATCRNSTVSSDKHLGHWWSDQHHLVLNTVNLWFQGWFVSISWGQFSKIDSLCHGASRCGRAGLCVHAWGPLRGDGHGGPGLQGLHLSGRSQWNCGFLRGVPWDSIFALNLRSPVSCWVWGPVLAKFTPLWVHSVDSWTPAPSTWDGPLVSFFIQPEVTKEGPTRETCILAGSSTEGKASKAERELLEEPWPWGA